MQKMTLCFLILLTSVSLFSATRGDLRKGGNLYQKKQYGQALSTYQQILKDSPANDEAAFGAGAASYYLKDYQTAQNAFEGLSNQEGKLQQDALFNLGNTYYRANQNDKAADAYRQAILKNPQDKEALHNLQLIINQQQNQNNQNDQNQQNQDKDSQNQDKNDNQNKGQSPQDGQQQNPSKDQMDKEDAQRVMQIARDNEHKAPQQKGNNGPSSHVEKDW